MNLHKNTNGTAVREVFYHSVEINARINQKKVLDC